MAVAAFVLLLAAGASAQRRHPRAEPSPPPAPFVPKTLSTGGITTLPPPPPPSPFAARPDTFAPHFDRVRPFRRGAGYGFGVPMYVDPFGLVPYAPPLASVAPPAADQPSAQVPAFEPPKTPAPIPEAPKVAAAHGPDTFYVIPGCYAGNRPPNPARLPKGCDPAKMRTTPVR
jgi:hypothetical protein